MKTIGLIGGMSRESSSTYSAAESEMVYPGLDIYYTVRYITPMDTQKAILGAALSLFCRNGYEGTGVQSIVETCGLTKPTLYHHFGSKAGLLEALLEAEGRPKLESLRRAAEYGHDITMNLTRITGWYLAFARQNPDFYRLVTTLSFAPRDTEGYRIAEPFHGAMKTILEHLFIEASGDHGNMKGRHGMYAVGFMGSVGALVLGSLDAPAPPDDGVIYQAVHHFMHGIFS